MCPGRRVSLKSVSIALGRYNLRVGVSPAARAQQFNENMVRFYVGKDATEMMEFLIECQPKDAPEPKSAPASAFARRTD